MESCSLHFYDPPQDGIIEEDTTDTDDDSIEREDSSDDDGCRNYGERNEEYFQWRNTEVIHDACKDGDLDQVKKLVLNGAGVSERDSKGRTPLHLASAGGHTAIVEFLLANGAKVHKKAIDGKKAIHIACERGHLEIVKALLSEGASIGCRTTVRCSPLHFACEAGHIEIVRLLLSRGADVNGGDTYRCDPLYHACKGGHLETVEFLIQKGASLHNKGCMGRRPLHVACMTGNTQVAESLLLHGAKMYEVDDTGRTAFHFACEYGHVEVVKLLISKGVDVEHRKCGSNWTPLHIACHFNSHPDIVRLLLAHGALVNDDDVQCKTALHHAITPSVISEFGNRPEFDVRINTKYHPDPAAYDKAELLLAHGALVNVLDAKNKTPLYYACVQRDVKLVQRLLAHGAKIEEEDESNPLKIACQEGFSEILNPLLAAHPISTKHATELLFISCQKDHPDIVKVLLAHGARVDTADCYGRKPLRQCYSAEVVRLLLSHGADMKTPNLNCTMLEPCSESVLGVLLDHGAWLGEPCRKYKCQCRQTEMKCRYGRAIRCNNQADIRAFNDFFKKVALLGGPPHYWELGVDPYPIIWPMDYDDQTAFTELNAIKSDTINNTQATYYDLLIRNSSALQDQPILENFNDDECLKKYPTYGDMIVCSYLKLKRDYMEEQSAYFFTLTLPALPLECAEAITAHLSNDDLKSILKACSLI